jgi:RLL motif-containing protein 1
MYLTFFRCFVFQYLGDVGCPYESSKKAELIDWLLGYAVRLEYGDDGEMMVFICSDNSITFFLLNSG